MLILRLIPSALWFWGFIHKAKTVCICFFQGDFTNCIFHNSYSIFLLLIMVFLSLSLNLLCVHLMFRGGKYNPSEISALNVFTMFWTNHRAYSDHMYYLWHYGYVLLCNILLFPQPKNGIFCKYIFLAD